MGNTFRTGKLMNGLYVDDSGNVGINTTSPSYKLDVNGTARITGAATFSSSVTANNISTSYSGLASYNSFGNNIFIQPNGANNSFIADNIYYSSGFKLANAGAGAMLYFGASAAGSIDFRTAPTGSSGGTPTITTRMTILEGGNVGIGTSSPSYLMTLYASTYPVIAFQNAGAVRGFIGADSSSNIYNAVTGNSHVFQCDSTERMRITSGGDVVIGATSYSGVGGATNGLEVAGTNAQFLLNNTTFNWFTIYSAGDSNIYNVFGTSGNLLFGTGNKDTSSWSEKMRITSAGNVGIGTSSINYKLEVVNSTNQYVFHSFNTRNTSGDVNALFQLGNNCNNTSSYFLVCSMPLGDRMYIYGNGNIVNINNSYGVLSDIKLKENIVDATPKLENLLKVKIRNYNLIGEKTKQIGVIAQELEQIFPSMIEEAEDFKEIEIEDEEGNIKKERQSLGTTTKSVKMSVFVPMLIKAIQEQQEIINQLSAKVTALENK